MSDKKYGDFTECEDELPPENELVLVIQELTGQCLRKYVPEVGWYDEAENYDDSELEVYRWTPLPP